MRPFTPEPACGELELSQGRDSTDQERSDRIEWRTVACVSKPGGLQAPGTELPRNAGDQNMI